MLKEELLSEISDYPKKEDVLSCNLGDGIYYDKNCLEEFQREICDNKRVGFVGEEESFYSSEVRDGNLGNNCHSQTFNTIRCSYMDEEGCKTSYTISPLANRDLLAICEPKNLGKGVLRDFEGTVDSDGDGYSDKLEMEYNTNINNFNAYPLGVERDIQEFIPGTLSREDVEYEGQGESYYDFILNERMDNEEDSNLVESLNKEIFSLGDFSVKLWMLLVLGGGVLLIITIKK